MIKKYIFLGFVNFWFQIAIAQTTSPNVLLIIADDLGTDATPGFQVSQQMPFTPTLDSLRQKGLTFTNVWSAPTCTPTRAAIMSGKYGVKTGVTKAPGHLATSHPSLFTQLDQLTGQQYANAVFGKWHISDPHDPNHPALHNVDQFVGVLNNGVSDYYNWNKTEGLTDTLINEYITDYLTNRAIDWVSQQSDPWVLWFAPTTPHSPFHIPPAGTYTTANTNSNKQKYMAAIENLDYNINKLIKNIPANELANTLIIFVGDNGAGERVNQNYPNNHAKKTLYQGGIHVPLIVSGYEVTRQNQVEPALVHVTDLYATILQFCGATLSGGLHNSRNFKALFQNVNASKRLYNYTDYKDNSSDGFTVRDQQYKVIKNVLTDGIEVFDLVNDPFETKNLSDSLTTQQASVVNQLLQHGETVRMAWPCNDGIKNGNEDGIDCGGSYCNACNDIITPDTSNVQLICNSDTLIICEDISVDTIAFASSIIKSAYHLSSAQAKLIANESITLEAGFYFNRTELEVYIDNCEVTGLNDNNCPNDNSTSQINIGCCASPQVANIYNETVSGNTRQINTNNFPNHDYCFNPVNMPSPKNYIFTVDASPQIANTTTSILTNNNRPSLFFGVAINGVLMAPAPATPFIFVNTQTGEYNWDWVFEPTNNQGGGNGQVKLDCASAHTSPAGYHYHGNMFEFAENIAQELSTTTTPPNAPVHIGWAADGFPILYRFGPDENGNLKLLQPGYRIRFGNRPGNGISAPCGNYNGKYTNDYEYNACFGDLDECNGIERSITLNTSQGMETFNYFYMVTDAFPQIGRCFKGTPDLSFD